VKGTFREAIQEDDRVAKRKEVEQAPMTKSHILRYYQYILLLAVRTVGRGDAIECAASTWIPPGYGPKNLAASTRNFQNIKDKRAD
jgi:hypothetical protein